MASHWVKYVTMIRMEPEKVSVQERATLDRLWGYPEGYFSGSMIRRQLSQMGCLAISSEVRKA